MVLAYLRMRKSGKKRKRYVSFVCDKCGKENKVLLDYFVTAYRASDGKLVCKYCGAEQDLELESNLEKIIERRNKK